MRISTLVKEHPLKFIVSIAVSLGLIYYSFKDLDWTAFWTALKSIDYWILLIAGILLMSSNVVRAARWRILLLPQKKIRRTHLFEATMMGYMGNNVLPFKLGEVLRAVVVAKRHNIKTSGVGASIVVERGLDMFSFLILAGIYGVLTPSFESAKLLSGLGLTVVLIVIGFGYFVNKYHTRIFGRVEKWAQDMAEKGHAKRGENLISVFKGLETIWRMPQPLQVVGQTILLWLLYSAVTTLSLLAFDFNLNMAELIDVSLVLIIFTTLSLAIPAAPGYVGTYHGAVLTALALFSINSDKAMAFAIVLHLLNYLLYTPTGAWYLMKAGLSLDLATEAAEDQ